MAATYAWIIDGDDISEGQDIGTIGPFSAPKELVDRLNAGEGKAFQMFDDDGERYYTGRIVGAYDELEPLDDFGTPNAGAVHIKYDE